MSYILDALKKVERERARARHPLLGVPGETPPARRRLWPWAVAGALVLNAVVAGVMLVRWSPGPLAGTDPSITAETARPAPETDRTAAIATAPPAAPAPAARVPAERAVAGATTASPERPARPERATPPDPTPARSEPRIARPSGRIEPDTASRAESPAVAPPASTPSAPPAPPGPPAAATSQGPPPITTPGVNPRPAPPPPAPAPVTTARPPESARSRSVSDLPPAFQTVVSGLKLEVLLYGATATERMVFINGRKYVEGQSLDGDVVVERITADGAVLARDGQRFLLTPSR